MSIWKIEHVAFSVIALWRAKENRQLIHTNFGGTMSTISLNDSRYFLLFTDDFTRIYFLKQKSKVFTVFQKFEVL